MTFLKIAWKNLFRNTRRTVIVGCAVGLGLAGIIFTDALILGMERNMIDNASSTYLGHAQIHNPEFRTTGEPQFRIIEPAETMKRVTQNSAIAAVSGRVIATALVSSPSKSQSIQMWGVVPENEKKLSRMDDRMASGSRYLPEENSILIGQGLADELGVVSGDRLILTCADINTGEPMQELFIVDGIYSFGSREMDMMCVVIHQRVAQRMLGMKADEIHEIAVRLHDPSRAENVADPLWKELGGPNVTEPWVLLMEELVMVMKMSGWSKYIMMLLLFILVGLNMINTLFMAIYERMFEFAVIKSIGTGRFQVFRMIVYEAVSLAIISSVIGSIIGWGLVALAGKIGIDYNSIEYSGITFYEKIYPVAEPMQFILNPLLLILFAALISLYPAIYAARMTPADALRKTL